MIKIKKRWYLRFSAHMIEAEGFSAIMLSGAGIQGIIAGYPDIGLTTVDDLVRETEYIYNYSNLPIIVDADAAGFTLDDTTGFHGYNRWGKNFENDNETVHPVVSRELRLAKIKAAVAACEGSDYIVIARTEAKMQYGIDEAIERCNLAIQLENIRRQKERCKPQRSFYRLIFKQGLTSFLKRVYNTDGYTSNMRGKKHETGNKILHMARGHLADGSSFLVLRRSWPECQGGADGDSNHPDSLRDQ